ncbi:MAG: 50S ribosomal protein L35 [Candidatus Paceibacterota bacterium]
MKTSTKPKTRKSIAKRFKITKNGKVLRRPVGQDHLLSKQTGHKRRRLRKMVAVSEAEAKKIKKLLVN